MTELKPPRPGNLNELADYQRKLAFLVDTGRMYLGEGWRLLDAAIEAEARAGKAASVEEVRGALNWTGGVAHPFAQGEPYSVASGLRALRASWWRDPPEHLDTFLPASLVKRTRRLFRERYGVGDETGVTELKDAARDALLRRSTATPPAWHSGTRVALEDALREAHGLPRTLRWTIRERWLGGRKSRKIPAVDLELQLEKIAGAVTPGGSLDRAALARIPDLDSDLVACALEDAPEVHGADHPLEYASGTEWKQPQGFAPAAPPAPPQTDLGFLEGDWREFSRLIETEKGARSWHVKNIRGYFENSLEEALGDLETGETRANTPENTTSLSRYRARLKLLDYLCGVFSLNAESVEPWGSFVNGVLERALGEGCTLVHTSPEKIQVAVQTTLAEFRKPGLRFKELGAIFGLLYKEAVSCRPWYEELVGSMARGERPWYEELVGSMARGERPYFGWAHRVLSRPGAYLDPMWDAVQYAADYAPEKLKILAEVMMSPAGPLGYAAEAGLPHAERDWGGFMDGARKFKAVWPEVFNAYPGTYARVLEGAPASVLESFEGLRQGGLPRPLTVQEEENLRTLALIEEPVVEKVAPPATRPARRRLRKVAEAAAGDAREVALRVTVTAAREKLSGHLSSWAEGRAPGSSRSFIHSEAGRGLTTYLLGLGWKVAQEKYRGELAGGLGADIAREIRLQGGEELVEGFYREVLVPLLAHLSNPAATLGAVLPPVATAGTRLRFEATGTRALTGGEPLEVTAEQPRAATRHGAEAVTPGVR